MTRHVYIATPVHDGKPFAEHVDSLIRTIPVLLQSGIAYTHDFLIGNALVHDARNKLVARFVASPATDLFFIDADICWLPDDFVKLLMSPHDVIGGAYRQKRTDVELYNAAGLKEGTTELMEVDYLGTGFLKIRRRAIERLQRKHDDLRYLGLEGEKCWGLFDTRIGDGKIVGEDVVFCRRWRAAGGKVFLMPNLALGHLGTHNHAGNFAALIARQQAEAKVA